jgi:hypothetical protein
MIFSALLIFRYFPVFQSGEYCRCHWNSIPMSQLSKNHKILLKQIVPEKPLHNLKLLNLKKIRSNEIKLFRNNNLLPLKQIN